MASPRLSVSENYDLQKPLGKGVFGEVFLAKDKESSDLVAIKKFSATETFEAPLIAGYQGYVAGLKTTIDNLKNLSSRTSEEEAKLVKTEDSLKTAENKDEFLKSKREAFYAKNPDEFKRVLADAKNSVEHEYKMLQLAGDAIGVEKNEAKNEFYIVMKLAPGESLTSAMKLGTGKANPLTAEELSSISTQLIDKVQSLQEKGIVLRDLHANNVMYDKKSGAVNIIDYGDALEAKKGIGVGQAMGSEPFISPEVMKGMDANHKQIQNSTYDEKTSVFTLGAMMAQMFGLAKVVDSQSVKQKGDPEKNIPDEMFKTIELIDPARDKRKPKIADPEIRGELTDLIRQMIVKEKDERTITLGEAKDKMSNIMDKIHGVKQDVSITHPPSFAELRGSAQSGIPYQPEARVLKAQSNKEISKDVEKEVDNVQSMRMGK